MKPELSANAITVLEKRYLLRDAAGGVAESPEGMFERVAQAVSAPEGRARGKWARRYFELMASRRFLPNSPTLMNAGKEEGQLSACFVLPIEDSLDAIFDTLKQAAKIHQSGGGTGFSFTDLRGQGSQVRSSAGVASGPVSFIRIFDTATETIKQGGARRGANMAILRADHPDIEAFVDAKLDQRSISNFNISVGATDEFMNAVQSDAAFKLKDPRTGEVIREIRAKDLFRRIAHAAWACGDPGLVFLDRINAFNPTPQLGPMVSTNPCGEQPLLPYESCNLGSLNLGEYAREDGIEWDRLREDVHASVRFLDSVIDVNCFPVEECARITHRNRKIGLGVMGFADLLLIRGIPYASEDAFRLGERLMSFVDREAKAASAGLANERGAFPNWKGSLWHRLGYPRMRNATVSTVAPTGTISLIAGASSGIEPIFAGIYYRNVLSGARLTEIHPAVERAFRARRIDPARLPSQLGEDRIARELGAAWSPAFQVPVEAHVRMQAVFQRHSDSAVSKTINLPQSASEAEVAHAYQLAYRSGCKGITVYRNLSKPTQVLEQPKSPADRDGKVCAVC